MCVCVCLCFHFALASWFSSMMWCVWSMCTNRKSLLSTQWAKMTSAIRHHNDIHQLRHCLVHTQNHFFCFVFRRISYAEYRYVCMYSSTYERYRAHNINLTKGSSRERCQYVVLVCAMCVQCAQTHKAAIVVVNKSYCFRVATCIIGFKLNKNGKNVR